MIRAVLLGAGLIMAGLPALAQDTGAGAGEATVQDTTAETQFEGRIAAPLPRLFPRWDEYLALDPETRSHFTLAYVVGSRSASPDEIRMWYELDGETVDLEVGPDGLIGNPPDAQAMQDAPDVWVNQPEGGMSMTLQFAYAPAPQASLDSHDLAMGLEQANRAVRRAAGVAALFAPNFKSVVFRFDGPVPDAVAVLDDGSTRPLLVQEDQASFRPGDRENRRVVRVEFGQAPSRILFDS